MNTNILLITLLSTLLLFNCSNENAPSENSDTESGLEHHEDDTHPDPKAEAQQGDEHEDEAGIVKLSPQQLQTAGIKITPLALRNVAAMIQAPGEVKLNDYQTVKITSRIAAQVVARHARLGDNVEKGQPLISLSSVDMADAQGELLVAMREWQRVKTLGRKVVSARRYTQAQVNSERASARALAFGMTQAQISDLLNNNTAQADGTFRLSAPQAGRVLRDEFIVGERIEPGRELMVIADESVMWVEARVTVDEAARIHTGNAAEINVGKQRLPAKVSQIHHALDETTRTLTIRLEVSNKDDRLHPGMFVNSRIATTNTLQVLAIPEAAVLRSPDGDWQIFVEQDEPGEFKAIEVQITQIADGIAIITGVDVGTPVVTQGAFFVQSELAKSGFDIHNH